MKKRKKKRKILLCLCLIIFLLIGFYLLKNRTTDYTKIEKVLFDISSSIKKVLTPTVDVDYTNATSGINKDLENKVKDLEKLLELKESKNLNLLFASVISRNEEYWFQDLTIDKGNSDGIIPDMAVITSDGLVGRIEKTANNSSKIKLLTDNSSNIKVSVDVETIDNNYRGIITDYDFSNNLIIVSNLEKDSKIEVGNIVTTNGLGKVYPTGIYIGEVVEITYDELGIEKIVKVKPKINYNDIRFVAIVKEQ